jgi:hypothetical protein
MHVRTVFFSWQYVCCRFVRTAVNYSWLCSALHPWLIRGRETIATLFAFIYAQVAEVNLRSFSLFLSLYMSIYRRPGVAGERREYSCRNVYMHYGSITRPRAYWISREQKKIRDKRIITLGLIFFFLFLSKSISSSFHMKALPSRITFILKDYLAGLPSTMHRAPRHWPPVHCVYLITQPTPMGFVFPVSLQGRGGSVAGGAPWRMLTYTDVCWRMLTYADVGVRV